VSQVVIWISDRRGCAGAVIDVLPDDHALSPAERENADWTTVRVTPDLTPSEAVALCAQSTAIQSRAIYRVDTTGLSPASVVTITKDDWRGRLREVRA
jgi:hypothetical protein